MLFKTAAFDVEVPFFLPAPPNQKMLTQQCFIYKADSQEVVLLLCITTMYRSAECFQMCFCHRQWPQAGFQSI